MVVWLDRPSAFVALTSLSAGFSACYAVAVDRCGGGEREGHIVPWGKYKSASVAAAWVVGGPDMHEAFRAFPVHECEQLSFVPCVIR